MTWAAFLTVVAIHLAAAMSPGPSFVVSVRVSAAEGFRTGAALALGFGLGAFLWATAAMAGLALLFQVIPEIYLGLKLIGAGFLLWIAYMLWRHAAEPLPAPEAGAAPRGALAAMRFGLLTFATNPKTAVFFSAVFVGLIPADTPLGWRLAVLAAVFTNEVLWYLVVARVFSLSAPRNIYLRLKRWLDRAFGALIAALALKIGLT
ncbi:LysE family translocator [Frigidibacter sp. ROC022]|uniref:LysE family translocator n=1 Tax=Frigidibacter sp. ROC022 TaxID=2971796 RepID=UPI00215B56F3|nr:LysE family transporter [Frigidibacter sp. ROC022]MCR8725572.1 LysE family transporter [Frigidibacter sp. ROC022]